MSETNKVFLNNDGSHNLVGPPVKAAFINMEDMQNRRKIGEGAQGSVEYARNPFFGQPELFSEVAIKLFITPRPLETVEQTAEFYHAVEKSKQREIRFTSEVDNHPNILRFYGYAKDRDELGRDRLVGIITEYMHHGSLDKYLPTFSGGAPVALVFKWSLQLARALAYCHNVHQVVHRDVKLDNCLVNENLDLKLCDFGFARNPVNGDMTKCVGTLKYMAPEVIYSNDRGYSFKADVWSYGMFLYALTHKTTPFSQGIPAPLAFRNQLLEQNLRPIINPEILLIYPLLCQIMFSCWETDPDDRPSMVEIATALDETVKREL